MRGHAPLLASWSALVAEISVVRLKGHWSNKKKVFWQLYSSFLVAGRQLTAAVAAADSLTCSLPWLGDRGDRFRLQPFASKLVWVNSLSFAGGDGRR